MTSWNEQDRTRSFLAAALVTAVCGAIFSTTDSTPRLASGAAPRADLSRTASGSFAADDASAPLDPLVAEAAPIAGPEERAGMKDAVAAPSLAPSLSAGPAGASGSWTAAARAAAAPGGGSPADSAARLAAQRLFSASASLGAADLKRSSRARAPGAKASASAEKSPLETPAARSPVVGARASSGGFEAPRPDRSFSQPPLAASAAESLGSQALSEAGRASASESAGAPASRLKKTKPALLDKLLGPRPLRPPRGAIRFPAVNPWKDHAAPEGLRPMTARDAESVAAPASAKHGEKLSGARHDGRFGWLERSGERVWLWPSPDGAALLAHEGHWWWQSRGVWFLLHDGEPWGWRYLNEWKREGLVHPSGVQMVYSDDGRRVGIVSPGEGAVLYDSTTGAELGRWSADELPKARTGKAPSRLRLP